MHYLLKSKTTNKQINVSESVEIFGLNLFYNVFIGNLENAAKIAVKCCENLVYWKFGGILPYLVSIAFI